MCAGLRIWNISNSILTQVCCWTCSYSTCTYYHQSTLLTLRMKTMGQDPTRWCWFTVLHILTFRTELSDWIADEIKDISQQLGYLCLWNIKDMALYSLNSALLLNRAHRDVVKGRALYIGCHLELNHGSEATTLSITFVFSFSASFSSKCVWPC